MLATSRRGTATRQARSMSKPDLFAKVETDIEIKRDRVPTCLSRIPTSVGAHPGGVMRGFRDDLLIWRLMMVRLQSVHSLLDATAVFFATRVRDQRCNLATETIHPLMHNTACLV